jgi:purine-binding chemotaxis protein CheW
VSGVSGSTGLSVSDRRQLLIFIPFSDFILFVSGRLQAVGDCSVVFRRSRTVNLAPAKETDLPHGSALPCLLVRIGADLAAVPLASVIETMRPQPVRPWNGAPAGVRGIAKIRGSVVPVVDLHALVSPNDTAPAVDRFVTVRAGTHAVAVGVNRVDGIRFIDRDRLEQLPSLLDSSDDAVVGRLATLDGELVGLLHLSKIVPEESWLALEAEGGL